MCWSCFFSTAVSKLNRTDWIESVHFQLFQCFLKCFEISQYRRKLISYSSCISKWLTSVSFSVIYFSSEMKTVELYRLKSVIPPDSWDFVILQWDIHFICVHKVGHHSDWNQSVYTYATIWNIKEPSVLNLLNHTLTVITLTIKS